MKKLSMPQIWQAMSYVLCLLLALRIKASLDGTELSGGWLTGPLLSMAELGIVLFVPAFLGTFLYPRVAAVIGLASSVLCLPLCVFFIAPVRFNEIFGSGHEFSVQPRPGFHWEKWTVTTLLALIVTCSSCIRRIVERNRPEKAPLRPQV